MRIVLPLHVIVLSSASDALFVLSGSVENAEARKVELSAPQAEQQSNRKRAQLKSALKPEGSESKRIHIELN